MSPASPTSQKARKQSHGQLNMGLFTPSSLKDEAALEHAISVFKRQLQSSTDEMHTVLSNFMVHPNLLEYLISIADAQSFDDLLHGLLETFPQKAHQFSTSFVAEHHRTAQLAPQALESLSAVVFPDGTGIQEGGVDIAAKKQTQRSRKKSWRNRAPTIDRAPFEKMKILVPETRPEADMIRSMLLANLKETLKFYLVGLRDTRIAETIKKAYFGDENEHIRNGANKFQAAESPVEPESSEDDQIPPAYPFIQPMKAAFHFDSVDGFGEWHILISTRADRNLRESKKKNPKLFAIILKKIKELSNGHFSDDNQKRLAGSDIDIPIFEAKMTGDTRLVYVVDCVKEYDSEIERQVLRVFGIYTHAQLDRRFWDAVSQHLAGKGKEYRKRCVFRKAVIHKGDKNIPPETFAPMETSVIIASPVLPNLRNEDREELHALLVLEKFIAFSQALLNSILADQDVVHVFQMSPAEQEIVKHAGSCYVLGRSGTGKTTTMLFKMLGIERTWESMREEIGESFSRPRQVFVTQSRVLAERVEEYYLKLTESHVAARRTAEEAAALAAAKNDRRAQGLVNRDEEEYYRGILPKRFADLKDEHFPLFVTFDHLCRLLEVHVKDRNRASIPSAVENAEQQTDETTSSSDYMLQGRNAFISYDVFLRSYWPHLPQPLTKGLDPVLVFAEFMGVIKGSEQASRSENGYLDRDSYVSLSHRQQGAFATRRGAVYTLFQSYLKAKRTRGEWDAADRTHTLLRGLRDIGVPGSKLDFVYIDEAQDNLLIDALILRTLCRNRDGFFWAGDTAQTISVGSSFRFNDLKSFLYRLEALDSGETTVESPPSFQLTVNYRSHGGIVRCAHSAVQIIMKLWPHAIDVLGEEKGIIDGAKPVFFSGWDQDTVQYEQFLFGATGSQIEFGAKQCILVRDDAARARLRDLVGDIGLVLTLYESKGLEFDDVLLYNFFEDSPVDVSQWRVILNVLPEQKGVQMKCPQFDETKHSGVCRELKLLYVGITRARKNFWIADCSERGQPLKTYWKALDLINDCSSADSAPRLATVSTPDEWAETAQNLFDHGRYSQAMRCYERGLMFRERDVAHAYYLREQAKLLPITRRTADPARVAAYVEAAQAFQRSAVASTNRNEIIAYNRIAGDCFVEIGDHARAAAAYRAAEDYTRSAKHYRKAGLFDSAVDVVRSHGDAIPEADADSILTVAKMYYFNKGHHSRAINLFPSFDEALEFMDDCGFDADRAKLLEEAGRLVEAAEYHISERRLPKAINLLLQDSSTPSKIRAEECLLDGLWQQLSFGLTMQTDANISGSVLADLLTISTRMIQQQTLSTRGRDEVAMFQAIKGKQHSALRALGQKFNDVGNTIAAVLCLDHAFGNNLNVQAASCAEIASILQLFVVYTRELAKIAYELDPATEPALQCLFGFYLLEESKNTVRLPAGTFLHYHSSQRNPRLNQDASDDILLSTWELKDLLHVVICDKLLRLVRDENGQCRRAPALSPCPPHAVLGICNLATCMAGHLDAQAMDEVWYTTRVRVIFQQILIYQAITPLEHKFTVEREQRSWLSRLYHTLHPVHRQLGSPAIAGLFSFPEAEKGIQVVRDWLRDAFYKITPWADESEHFLTIVAELATLAFRFDKDAAQSYIERAPCVARERPLRLLRGIGGNRRYIVHDLLCCLDGASDIIIPTGVLFLQTVIANELRLDLDVLCHLVDRISSYFVVSYRIRRYGSIHDTTLMREWILQLYGEAGEQDTRLLPLFLNLMTDLVNEVYTGRAGVYTLQRLNPAQGSLLLERSLKIDYQQRHLFVARLFRSLVILGYNIPDSKIRWDIRQIITSLCRPSARYPKILIKYITASRWDDLVKALRASSQSDALVQVKERNKCNGPVRQLRGVHVAIFGNVNEIPSLLRNDISATHGADMTPDTLSQVPVSESLQAHGEVSSERVEASEDQDEEPSSPEEEDTGIDHYVDLEAAARSADVEHVYQAPAAPTEEEIAAARLIAKAYRLSFARRHGAPKKGLAEARARWFSSCAQQSQDLCHSYRCLYLGPLPHALVCLEGVINYAGKAKKSAQTRLKGVEHEEYERVSEDLSRAMKVIREAMRLKKLLAPTAEMHHKQDAVLLKTRVVEVETLVRGLPPSEQLWELDLGIAVKGIVVERKPPKPKLRPSLVIEDDLVW